MSIINILLGQGNGGGYTPPPVEYAPYRILMIGDSTTAIYPTGQGLETVAHFMFTSGDLLAGYYAESIAVPGQTAAQQKTEWIAFSDKNLFDAVSIQIGLNNLATSQTYTQILSEVQDLIDEIKTDVPSIKVFVVYTTPAKQRWEDVFPGSGASYLAKQLSFNDGLSTLTDVDGIVSNNYSRLSDGTDNLQTIYNVSPADWVHYNNLAREIDAEEIRNITDAFFLSGNDYIDDDYIDDYYE